MLSSLLQDIRYAVRRLAASPGFHGRGDRHDRARCRRERRDLRRREIRAARRASLRGGGPLGADLRRPARRRAAARATDGGRGHRHCRAAAVVRADVRVRQLGRRCRLRRRGRASRSQGRPGSSRHSSRRLAFAAAQGRTLRPEDATSGFGPLSGGAQGDDTASVRDDFARRVAAAVLGRSRRSWVARS